MKKNFPINFEIILYVVIILLLFIIIWSMMNKNVKENFESSNCPSGYMNITSGDFDYSSKNIPFFKDYSIKNKEKNICVDSNALYNTLSKSFKCPKNYVNFAFEKEGIKTIGCINNIEKK